MRINLQNHNQRFNGYKNIISDMQPAPSKSCFSFMSMQLDNDGEADLDTWKIIQKDLCGIKNPNDVITFQCIDVFNHHKDFYLSDKLLVPEAANKKDEYLVLKAFSLIASLTRRILQTSLHTVDKDFSKTLFQTRNNIAKFVDNDLSVADRVIYSSVQKNISKHVIAETINKNVHQILKAYLK